MTGERRSSMSSRSVIRHDMQRPATRNSEQASSLGQSIPAVRFPGSSMSPAVHPCYYQYPATMLYPIWVASCIALPPFGPPQQYSSISKGLQHHPGEQAYWQCMTRRGANRMTKAGFDSEAGTGVFLPKDPPSVEASEESVSLASMQGSESDVDSLNSATDCFMLGEEAPIKRGQFGLDTSIEQLLPEEWEY